MRARGAGKVMTVGRGQMTVIPFITHSKKAINLAVKAGWLPGARYTNLHNTQVCPTGFSGYRLEELSLSKPHKGCPVLEAPSTV